MSFEIHFLFLSRKQHCEESLAVTADIYIYIYIDRAAKDLKGNPTRFGKDNIGFGAAALFSSLERDCYVPRLAYLIIRCIYMGRVHVSRIQVANSGSRAFFAFYFCFLRTEETGLRLFLDGAIVGRRIYIETTVDYWIGEFLEPEIKFLLIVKRILCIFNLLYACIQVFARKYLRNKSKEESGK